MTYKAFLSYSHARDAMVSRATQAALHRFAKRWNQIRAIRIFRDETSLSANPALWSSIERALSDSEFFVLLASPESARSQWVSREASWWIEHRTIDTFLVVLTAGELSWDGNAGDFDWRETTALSSSLSRRFREEPLHVDLRWVKSADELSIRHTRFRSAVVDLAATLHGKPKDELDGEDVRQHRRFRRFAKAGVLVLSVALLVTALAAVFAVRQSKAAEVARRGESVQRKEAETAAQEAQRQRDIARVNQNEAEKASAAESVARKEAERQARQADARALAIASSSNLQADPERSLLLAINAVTTTLGPDHAVLPQAENSLRQAIREARLVRTLSGHTGPVWDVAYSPDGQHLASVSEDGSWRLWDANTGKQVRNIVGFVSRGGALVEMPSAPVHALAFSPNGSELITAQLDNRAKVWDVSTGKGLGSLYRRDSVWKVAYSPDGARLATGSTDGIATVWDRRSGDIIREFKRYELMGERSATAVAFSSDSKRLATAGRYGSAELWDITSGKEICTFRGHDATQTVHQILFSPDGKTIGTAGEEGTVRLWNSIDCRESTRLTGGASQVLSVAFSRDSKLIAAGTRDKTIEVWSAETGRKLFSLAGHTGGVWGVAFSPDGTHIASASYDGTVRVWLATSSRPELPLISGHAGKVFGVAFSPDGKRVATTSDDTTARVWDAQSGNELIQLRQEAIFTVAFSPNGELLLTSGVLAKLWDSASGREVRTFNAPEVTAAVFSADGTRIATAHTNGMAIVWDTTTGRQVHALTGHQGSLTDVAFAADDLHLATASADGTARIWDLRSGKPIRVLEGHTASVTALAFSPDGQSLATVSEDNQAIMWKAKTWRQMFTFGGHNAILMAVVFSPDSTRVATAGMDRLVKVWDRSTGEELLELGGHTQGIRGLAFSRDGKLLASASEDRTVRMHLLQIGDLLALAKTRVHRPLTMQELKQFAIRDQGVRGVAGPRAF